MNNPDQSEASDLIPARELGRDEKFVFRCGPEIACFTDCCHQLELALTPYDVLRMRQPLGLTSGEFLEQYAIIEKSAEAAFPQVFLAMVDDGHASCPFVEAKGCTIYQNRPGACRTYPVGRGAFLDENGRPSDFHVLLTEPHCRGFGEGQEFTLAEWVADQELATYNELNDAVMAITQHRQVRDGLRPTTRQQERYLTVLYDLDTFRRESAAHQNLDDQELLKSAIRLLHDELFS